MLPLRLLERGIGLPHQLLLLRPLLARLPSLRDELQPHALGESLSVVLEPVQEAPVDGAHAADVHLAPPATVAAGGEPGEFGRLPQKVLPEPLLLRLQLVGQGARGARVRERVRRGGQCLRIVGVAAELEPERVVLVAEKTDLLALLLQAPDKLDDLVGFLLQQRLLLVGPGPELPPVCLLLLQLAPQLLQLQPRPLRLGLFFPQGGELRQVAFLLRLELARLRKLPAQPRQLREVRFRARPQLRDLLPRLSNLGALVGAVDLQEGRHERTEASVGQLCGF
mmetsp:Transcript_101306/g.264170  ORF Transcript_101306/g.264170 Transcript_101306/m.264170 type:complete len:281 (-) Transcript_101306:408-1250(-)